MCTALGFEVTKLRRVRIMNVHLAGLAQGHWRYLTAEETQGVMRLVAGSNKGASASKLPPAERPVKFDKTPAKGPGGARPQDKKATRPDNKAPKPRRKDAETEKTGPKAGKKAPAANRAAEGPVKGTRGGSKSSSYKAYRDGSKKGR
jgi:23S rRNA pseudouridine2604 synthase